MADGIAWPSDLGYGQITGQICYLDGDTDDAGNAPEMIPAQGTVLITPSVKFTKYTGADGNRILAVRTISGKLDVNGYIIQADGVQGISVPASDDTELNPTNWTYNVKISITGAGDLSFDTSISDQQVIDVTTAVRPLRSKGEAISADPRSSPCPCRCSRHCRRPCPR